MSKLEGSIILRGDVTDVCYGKPSEFIALLLEKLGIEFPMRAAEDFVVYGFTPPGPDEKGRLWVATDRANHFIGFYLFVDGKFQRVYNHSNQDVIWKVGDSRKIEPGFQLIDGTVEAIPVPVQQQIMSKYVIDPDNSSETSKVYTYFATVYLGI